MSIDKYTNSDEWVAHCKKMNRLNSEPYELNLINNLREIYLSSLPASIFLLNSTLVDKQCFLCSHLITQGFDKNDEYSILKLKINSLKLKYQEEDNHIHYVAKRVTPDGKELIYNTSDGRVYDAFEYLDAEGVNSTDITVIPKESVEVLSHRSFTYGEFNKNQAEEMLAVISAIKENEDQLLMDYKKLLSYEINLFKEKVERASIYDR